MVGSRWIYTIKHVVEGRIERHKAIFVAKEFSDMEGMYYEETFSRVERY